MTFVNVAVALLVASFVTAAVAQEAAGGKWRASVDTPQGAFVFHFDLAVEGKTLTGTLSTEMMGSAPISEGTVNGEAIAFKVKMAGGPNGSMTLSYSGTVVGEQLKLVSSFQGPPGRPPIEQSLIATRVN
jgi:hypothetical protein